MKLSSFTQVMWNSAPLILLTAVFGCGGQGYPGPPRGAVHGKVTFDGEVIGHGNITFLPASSGGVAAGGAIENGEFRLAEEFGPTLGEQTVQIHWQKPTGNKIKDADSGQEIEETREGLPDKFHQNSQEKVTIKSGRNELNFPLKSP